VLTETAARWLLVLHTAVGVAAVGAATHLVVWLRRYVRGEHGRRRSVIRFAWLVLALQLTAFACGAAMYPTYKVEVRSAFLENPAAIMAVQAEHGKEMARIAAREGETASEPVATVELVHQAASAARWFDAKEHWVALGIFVAGMLVLVLALWDPREGRAIAPVVLALGGIACGTLWFAAIVGVLTASWRAV
jgi:hypothetical protein